MTKNYFLNYIVEVAKVKDELEHSSRTFLQILLKEFADKKKITITHEPKRDKKGRGAPDFKFLSNDVDIGYLETKKIGENLDEVLNSEQIRKYQTLTDNLILTDYLRWIWIYKDTIAGDVRLCEKTLLEKKSIKLNEQSCLELQELILDFFSQKPQKITRAGELAKILAKPTSTIQEEIEQETQKQIEGNEHSELKGLLSVFRENISETITPQEFSDAFAQTLTYSLFLTKLNLTNPSEKLNLSNISAHTPSSFALIKDILKFIEVLDKYPALKPYIERILHIINHTDAREVSIDLQFTEGKEKDPYIYFYEDFLKAYNPNIRVDAGVYYTPEPVVHSIVRNVHEILVQDFALAEGLADDSVKILDFACGTGTFLLSVYQHILANVSPNSLKKQSLIKNHLLKNIFGFELLIPAYCVSHLKLSQYLKDDAKYHLADEDRIQVYLTNTLENRDQFKENNLTGLFPDIASEGRKAQKIKEDNAILVVLGNPPYKAASKNNFQYIQDLIKPYFPNDEIKERNPKWLQDDYVKFIRFAENKINKAGRGVVGIITNHSFLDNPTFRQMRKHLMETFDKIYIVDLHGNTKKKEKRPDGSPDQNVFDIQQGVAISLFVKTDANDRQKENKKDAQVFRLDVFGKRNPKLKQVSELRFQSPNFKKIIPANPFYLFTRQNATLRKEYNKGWSLKEVFLESGVGLITAHDDFVINIKKEHLVKKFKKFKNAERSISLHEQFNVNKKKGWDILKAWDKFQKYDDQDIKNLVQKINYRPFDTSEIIYEDTLVWRTVRKFTQHFSNHENLGLVFTRQVNEYFAHSFISANIIESCFISNKTKEVNYIAPLYLYESLHGQEEKTVNFKAEFAQMVAEKFNNPSPEQVLGYIYAVLHSPKYRKKYLEFLKIDFPRIPFDVSVGTFKKLAEIGQELIDVHLMKKIPSVKIGEPEKNQDEEENYIVEKLNYDGEKQKLYFNKSCYFGQVSPEVWNFKIGGYQVLDKYLKSRKGRDISEDLEQIQNIINILSWTIKKMKEIERLI